MPDPSPTPSPSPSPSPSPQPKDPGLDGYAHRAATDEAHRSYIAGYEDGIRAGERRVRART